MAIEQVAFYSSITSANKGVFGVLFCAGSISKCGIGVQNNGKHPKVILDQSLKNSANRARQHKVQNKEWGLPTGLPNVWADRGGRTHNVAFC